MMEPNGHELWFQWHCDAGFALAIALKRAGPLIVCMLGIAMVVGGCWQPPVTEVYGPFVSGGQLHGVEVGSYIPHLDGQIIVDMIPKSYPGHARRGLSVRNFIAPEESEAVVFPPDWAKGTFRMVLMVTNMNAAKRDWYFSWDVYQGEERKQTVQVSVTPPPDVYITVDGVRTKAHVEE